MSREKKDTDVLKNLATQQENKRTHQKLWNQIRSLEKKRDGASAERQVLIDYEIEDLKLQAEKTGIAPRKKRKRN